jgi:energy-converting hydrogenase Eha subunit C
MARITDTQIWQQSYRWLAKHSETVDTILALVFVVGLILAMTLSGSVLIFAAVLMFMALAGFFLMHTIDAIQLNFPSPLIPGNQLRVLQSKARNVQPMFAMVGLAFIVVLLALPFSASAGSILLPAVCSLIFALAFLMWCVLELQVSDKKYPLIQRGRKEKIAKAGIAFFALLGLESFFGILAASGVVLPGAFLGALIIVTGVAAIAFLIYYIYQSNAKPDLSDGRVMVGAMVGFDHGLLMGDVRVPGVGYQQLPQAAPGQAAGAPYPDQIGPEEQDRLRLQRDYHQALEGLAGAIAGVTVKHDLENLLNVNILGGLNAPSDFLREWQAFIHGQAGNLVYPYDSSVAGIMAEVRAAMKIANLENNAHGVTVRTLNGLLTRLHDLPRANAEAALLPAEGAAEEGDAPPREMYRNNLRLFITRVAIPVAEKFDALRAPAADVGVPAGPAARPAGR